MSMLTLNGKVENCFTRPPSTDRETGEIRPGADYAQILAYNVLESGEQKLDMVTLKVPNLDVYKKLEGQRVSIPVGYFVKGNALQFYALRNEPNPIPAA
jgi:hypothetical protein